MPLEFDLEKVDWGAFGIDRDETVETPEDVVEERGAVLPQDQILRGNFSEALSEDPVTYAKNTSISRLADMPLGAVEVDPAAVVQDLKFDHVDFSGMSKRSPHTSKFLVDYNNAAVAQRDVSVLETIEEWLTPVAEYGQDLKQAYQRGQAMTESAELGLQGMWNQLGLADPLTDVQQLRLVELEEDLQPSERDYGFFVGAPVTLAEQIPIIGDILYSGVVGTAGGAGSGALIGSVLPAGGTLTGGLAGGKIGGRAGVAKGAFDLEAGLAYLEFSTMRDGDRPGEGNLLDPQLAAIGAATVGAINAGLEFAALWALGRTVTPAMRSVIRSKVRQALGTETGREMLKRLGTSYLVAVGGGAITEVMQEFTNVVTGEILKYIDEDSFTEQDLGAVLDNVFSEETGERLAEGAKAGAQASGLLAVPGTVTSAVIDTRQRERLALNEQLRLDALNRSAQKVQFKELDSGTFKDFVNEADGDNNTHVFVDSAQASLYMQTKTPVEIADDPVLEFINEQLADAATRDSEIQIPIAEFLDMFSGTEHFDALRPSMTMSEHTAAPFRQAQEQKFNEGYFRRLVRGEVADNSQYVQAQEIFDQVKSQLIDTGRVTAQEAAVMADIVPAWATVYAKSNGLTVEEVFQQAGLTIVGPFTGEKARLQSELAQQRAPAGEQLDMFAGMIDEEGNYVDTEERDVQDVQPPGKVRRQATKVGREKVKEIDVGFGQLSDPYTVAAATKSLSKSAQEKLWAVVTDENHQPIEILNHSMGLTASSQVDPTIVAGWAVNVPGAARVWISHNHPSGNANLSEDDLQISDRIDHLLQGSGVEYHGVMAVTPDAFMHRAPDGSDTLGPHRDPDTERRVDVVERTLETVAPGDTPRVQSPAVARDILEDFSGGEEGIVLLNHAHQPVGFLPVNMTDLEEPVKVSERLRTDRRRRLRGGALGEILSSLESTNASAAILNAKSWSASAENVTNMLSAANINVLDVFAEGTSLAERGPAFATTQLFVQDTDSQVRGYYDPATTTIRLTEASDLSTFLHEFAHFMLEMEFKAKSPDALDAVFGWVRRNATDVVAEANSYLGQEFDALKQQNPPTDATGGITENDLIDYIEVFTSGDFAKDDAIRRAIHEQFARGFEAYLMEGKAPSIELRSAFRTIARWLTQIYRALGGGLKVNLDPEARAFFDRLLATDEQIAAAESRARYEPMFTDAAMAGKTEEEYQEYLKQQEKTKDKQTETLRDKLVKQLTRQTKKWWKEEKEDLIQEEIASLKETRAYKALERLKAPVTDKNETTERLAAIDVEIRHAESRMVQLRKENDNLQKFLAKAGGLDRDIFIAEGVDPADIKTAKSGVFGKPLFRREGGKSPDEVAEMINEMRPSHDPISANDALDLVFRILEGDEIFVNPDVLAEVTDLESGVEAMQQEQVQLQEDLRQVGMKLDWEATRDRVGVEKTDKRGKKSIVIPPVLRGSTVKEGGLQPDEAAAFLGYASGDEMLKDITTVPPIRDVAESAAEQRMIQRHGDILRDGTIEQAADDAVQNEERANVMYNELRTLARGTRRPVMDRDLFADLAAENIGKLSYREIHPGKYRKAEIKAAQEAAVLHAQGDLEGAQQAKTRQIMHYYLGKAASEAKADTLKIVDRMGRYRKRKVQAEIMKAGNGYWDQLAKVLERFEFRKSTSIKAVDAVNQAIAVWAEQRLQEDGDQLQLSPAVLDENYITHWKNVPHSELKGIDDSVRNIEHVAKYSNEMNTMSEELDYKQLRSRWVSHIEQNTKKFDTKTSRGIAADVRKNTPADVVRKWASQLTKVPFLASWLDGGERVGLSHDIMVQPFTDALDAKYRLSEQHLSVIIDAIEGRSKEDKRRHQAKITIPEIGQTIEGNQVLAVALNTGNAGNLRKMLLGEGWADEDNPDTLTRDNPKLQAVLQHMTKSDWDLVQLIWDEMNKLYPALADVHEKTTGIRPPKVEATPVQTPYGEYAGGYYPVKYSPRRSHKAAKNAEKLEAETESMFDTTASIRASVSAAATNERTGFYDKMYLSLEVVPDHFNEVIHFITHHEPVRQLNKLIRDPVVEDAMTAVMGEAEFQQLKPWLNDIAKDGRQQPTKTFLDSAFQRLKLGVTVGVMGFSASTGVMQIWGLLTTAAEVGPKSTVRAVASTIGNSWYGKALRRTLGSVDDIQSNWDFASEKSKVLSHRAKTLDREIKSALERLQGKQGVLPILQEVSLKHIGLIQMYTVDLPTWIAAYDKTVSETGDEARAVNYADWAVENLQGSGATKDMAFILRNQSKVIQTFTMFMTFFSSLGNLGRDLIRGRRSGRYNYADTAAKLMFLYTIPVFLEMAMRGDLDAPEEEGEEDKRLSEYMTALALYPLTAYPGARDLASGTIGDFGYSMTPVASVLEAGIEGIKGATKAALSEEEEDEITASQIKRITKLAGAIVGLPATGQVWKTGEHLYDVLEEGEELTLRELGFGPTRD
jgi:hypothetical protein